MMSDVEIVLAAYVRMAYNFWPVIVAFIGFMAWEWLQEPRQPKIAEIKKNNNIR